MKLLVLFLVFVWASAQDPDGVKDEVSLDPCKKAYDECEKEWVNRTRTLSTAEEKCSSAQLWNSCLLKAIEEQSCDGDGETPETLQQETDIHCGLSKDCKEAQDACQKLYETNKGSGACAAVKALLKCSRDAQQTGKCKVLSPEVLEEEKKSCKVADRDGECMKAVDECQSGWEQGYDDGHPNDLKCSLAQTWSRCLKDVTDSDACQTESVDTPGTLDQQMSFCGLPEQAVDDCEAGEKLCEDTWASTLLAATTSPERCSAATSWAECLERKDFLDDCPSGVEQPVQVKETQLYHCAGDKDSCSGMEDECARQFLVSRDRGNDKCASSKTWRECLEAADKKGCGIAFPSDLAKNLELCGNKEGCSQRVAQCKVDYDNQAPSKDRCDQAQAWRDCLVELLGVCKDQVRFPKELDRLEATSCYIRDSASCLSEQTKCKKEYQDNVALTGPSCVYVTQWRTCLEGLMKTCEETRIPMELNREEVEHCYDWQSSASSCADKAAKCKKAYDDALPSSKNVCGEVTKWRSCLEALMGECTIKIPVELNRAEAFSCYKQRSPAASADASGAIDAGGATLSCDERAKRCKRNAVISNRRTSNRCDQAMEWRSCLVGLQHQGGCQHVQFPRELDHLEAISCYIAPAPRDDKGPGHGEKDCKKKIRKCKPRKTRTCKHAKKWRKCLEALMSKCGSHIFPHDLNKLQATTCYGR